MGLSKIKLPSWESIHTIVFDFDGVFTNNKVYVDQNGVETVCCDRGDGLGFDLLRNFIKHNNWDLNYFMLSKEKNPVVSRRAEKMQVACVQSTVNKGQYLIDYLACINKDSKGLVFLGNDLNDLPAIQIAGFSVAPFDSHPKIIEQANLVLPKNGGDGFVREFIELIIRLNEMPNDELLELL